jgi:3'-5' exoribonuclease
LLEHSVGVSTLCRETAQLHPRLRSDLLLAAALLHDVGRVRELGRGPAFRQTEEGRLLGHVHLGLRLIEERARDLDPAVLAELLHAIACHHDRQAARTAEAAVLYHANQLDAQAATRPVGDD